MNLDRYRRQSAFHKIGLAGQQRLADSRVLICGCGALGTAQANLLARAGVGKLTLVDRDFVDFSNLQRQSLFDENDVQQHQPKAVAAAQKLSAINSQIEISAKVADVTCDNIASLIQGHDIVLDGTDNFETRFLLNDACCDQKIPWVFGGCLGSEGQSMTIVPQQTACFSCLMPEPPDPGVMATCDTGGILGTIIQLIAAIQVNEALKLLVGDFDSLSRQLTAINLWNMEFRKIHLARLANRGCEVCRDGKYQWLSGNKGRQAKVLCGRNSVQIAADHPASIDLPQLAERLRPVGEVLINPYLLRLQVPPYGLTVFPDARCIVSGTEDPAVARTLVSRYLGL